MLLSINQFTYQLARSKRGNKLIKALSQLFVSTLLVICFTSCTDKTTSTQNIASAKEYLADSDYKAATIELKNALGKDGGSAEARWLLGNVYLQEGDILSAEKEILQAEKLGWNQSDIRPALATVFFSQGKLASLAQLEYSDLTLQSAARLLSVKARAELAMGNPLEARKLIDLALTYSSDLLEVRLANAKILAGQKELTSALKLIEAIIKDTPHSGEAYSLMGDILLRQKKPEEARTAFETAIEQTQNPFQERLKHALISMQLEDYKSAQKETKRLLKTSPKHPASNYIQGLLYIKEKKYTEAINALTLAEPAAKQFPLILFYLASSHLINGNRNQAENYTNQLLSLEPDNGAGIKLLATIELLKGNSAQAQLLLQPLQDKNSNDTEALNLLANAFLLQGKTSDAISLLQRVVALKPDSEQARVRLGASLVQSGRSDEANEIFDRLLAANPEFQQADILRVLDRVHQKDFEAALKAAKAYLERNPRSATALYLLGKVNLANKQVEAARESFKMALDLDPGNPGAHDSLAIMALAINDTKRARQHYETTLKHHPDLLSALLKLAHLDQLEHKEKQMVSHLEQAIQAHPQALEPRLLLGRHYLSSGKPELVTSLFTPLSRRQRQLPQVLHLLAVAQLAAHQYEDALHKLELLVEYRPDSADYHHLLSMAASGAGAHDRARQELSAALQLDENYLPALVTLARQSLREDHPEQFNHYTSKLNTLAPDHPDVLRLRAASALHNGDTEKAIDLGNRAYVAKPTTQTMLELSNYYQQAGHLDRALTLQRQWTQQHHNDVAALITLASLLELSNLEEDAVNQYQKVIKIEPDNLIARNNLAWRLRFKDPANALEHISHALRLAPDQPAVLDTLAVLKHLSGNNLEASQHIRHALEFAPEHPSMRYHQAMIEAALGNTASAMATLEAVLENTEASFPERSEAERLLARLKG